MYEQCKHEWKNVYYGSECTKCGLFYVDGCAPWLWEEDDTDDENECWTCETCGGEHWPGGTSCDCDLDHCVDCGAIGIDACCCCGGSMCPQCFECSCGFCNECMKAPDFADRMEAIYAEAEGVV